MKSLSGLVIALSLMLVFQPVLSQEDLVISPGDGLSTAGALGMFGLILGVIGLILIIPFLIIYIYSALVLSAIAKKTNTENPWFAWVPFLNYVLMARIGKVPVWTAIAFILIIVAEIVVPFFISLPSLINLLILIPVLIIFIVWWMKISEARGKPKWWGILIALIPIVNIVLMGILAWSGGGRKAEESAGTHPEKTQRPQVSESPQEPHPNVHMTEEEKLSKIVAYVKQNVSQGYDIAGIKDSLIEQGLNVQLIEKAIEMSKF